MNSLKIYFIKNKLNILFIIFIFIFIIPRFIIFTTNEEYTPGFAHYYFPAKSIVIDHQFPLIGFVVGDIGGFAQGAGWFYLLSIPFYIFNGNPYGIVVTMFVLSVLTLIAGTAVAWRYLGKVEGFFIGVLIGSSNYLIRWANDIWPPYFIPLLMVTYILGLILFISKKNNHGIYLATSSLALMAHFEIASLALLFPSFIILIIYLFYIKLINETTIIKNIVVFSLFFIPHLIYDLNHNFYNLNGLLDTIIMGSDNNKMSIFSILADRLHLIKTDLTAVFPISNYKTLLIFFSLILLGFNIILRDKKIKKWKKIFITHLLSIIPITFIMLCIIPVERASFWWFTYLTITYIFFSGIILSYLLIKKGLKFKLLVVLIMSLLFLSSLSLFNKIKNNQRELIGNRYVIKIQKPIEYIFKDSKNMSFKVLYLTGRYEIVDYKYMFWYIGNKNYRNSQALHTLDTRYTELGGEPTRIDERKQFDSLKSGTYYIVISKKSLLDGSADKIINEQKLMVHETNYFDNDLEGFVIKKMVIK